MNELPIGVGDSEAQKRFLGTHQAFLREHCEIHALLNKVFIRALVISTQDHQIEQIGEGLELSDAAQIEAEDRVMAQPVVFYLGRVAADDFGELLVLAGNGRGIGAYKILRGMYERVVTAAFIAHDASEARHFLAHADIERGKLWKRIVELIPDIRKRYTEKQIRELEHRHKEAQSKLNTEICKKCNQPKTQEAWTRASLDAMAQKADPQLAVPYSYCYLLPTFHSHATAFGLESRLRKTDSGYCYQELSEAEARNAVLYGHGLILRLLKLQNAYFDLGLDTEISARYDMFTAIWGTKDPTGF